MVLEDSRSEAAELALIRTRSSDESLAAARQNMSAIKARLKVVGAEL
jgi:hypothetical protein